MSEPGTDERALPLPDLREPVRLLLRDLRTTSDGLRGREAARRLQSYGPNELHRVTGPSAWRQIGEQLLHPLALLLWAAAALSWVSGTPVLAGAIVAVVLVNAAFAFAQEQQAERAVEALGRYLPEQASVLRDGGRTLVPAREVVPGDVVVLEEGQHVPADARLLTGSLEVDLSALTGESQPVERAADAVDPGGPLLQAPALVFSGSSCTGGEATALVLATGMRTELGRVAALSQRVRRERSPLEQQVRRVAWVIAAVAVGFGLAFLPIGVLGAGLTLADSVQFAIGLLVANVPEGLLPTITLALAVGVRELARAGALVKRLSAVETLGSTTVICTDKTGTLTENRMRVVDVWTLDGPTPPHAAPDARLRATAAALAACNNAELTADGRADATPDDTANLTTDWTEDGTGDPTEVALLAVAARLGADVRRTVRERDRRRHLRFDPALRLMSTVDAVDGGLRLHTKGAPEQVLDHCVEVARSDGRPAALDAATRKRVAEVVDDYAASGLRVIAVAARPVGENESTAARAELEQGLCLLAVVALRDPPRPEVADAVARCHEAGLRIHIVTGDHPATAAAMARIVGIGGASPTVVNAAEFEQMTEDELDALLATGQEVVFARSSPETKLRITDALKDAGDVVAMTGDGVNDAPALHRADIGVAMGQSGTDVAREAATMILTDDNFATIVTAIEAGRRVYDNVRKFILYIFAHAMPEAIPFLVFALSGGRVPLPLTVLQILAIDLGTETLPALALGREPAEPGLMQRPPRPRRENVIQPSMLYRAWVVLGLTSAALVTAGFFWTLYAGGWTLGADTATGPLHHVYLQATTMTFLGIVACQVGTAFAARTDRASLRQVGLLTNPLLLWGIGFELAFAALLVWTPGVRDVFGMAAPAPEQLALLLAFPVVVWGVDELRRGRMRRAGRGGRRGADGRRIGDV